tara:strand:- start:258 stop:1205 length:948 start_codon:yes stop_codon:yes gene_type:complete
MNDIKNKICVVLPTKNESDQIAKVIFDIFKLFKTLELSKPVILITDDSNDDTRKIAQEAGAEVINGGGKGLGFAMFQGLKHALKFNPKYILTCDSDGQTDINEIPNFLEPLENGEADLVIGSRFLKPNLIDYRYRWINRFGVMVLSKILRSFTGQKITDSHGGLRAMRYDVANELEMLGVHTYVQETIIDASEKGFIIKEIPSVWKKRKSGKSRVVGSIPTYVFYTLPILIIRSKQYIKWTYSIGIIFILAAVFYFAFISWQSSFEFKTMFSRLPSFVLIGVLIIAGIQLFFFGFIIQIIKNIKYSLDRMDQLKK